MKSTAENSIDVLNDLIRINNDRVAGYEKAIDLISEDDTDLLALFNSMKQQSRELGAELTSFVAASGKEAEKGTRTDGKIYRAWMSIKATFSGNDRKSVLASCERGEDAAQKAYDEALGEDLTEEAANLITGQKNKLKGSHDKIRDLRDMQHA